VGRSRGGTLAGPDARGCACLTVIDEVDQQVTRWVEEVLPGVSVTLDGPATAATADVALHLFEVADLPPARGEEPPPLQVRLGYLVTTSGSDVALAHNRLGTLLFAALSHPDWGVRFVGDIAEFWSASGVPPRAGFILTVPVRQPVETKPAPPVRVPLRVQGVGTRAMEGVVLGPGDVPVSDAFIEIPSLGLTTRSDTRGRFRFAAVPAAPAKQQLRVRAKAREFPFTVDSSKPSPFVLRLDLAKV
jgi:hypothetical protein